MKKGSKNYREVKRMRRKSKKNGLNTCIFSAVLLLECFLFPLLAEAKKETDTETDTELPWRILVDGCELEGITAVTCLCGEKQEKTVPTVYLCSAPEIEIEIRKDYEGKKRFFYALTDQDWDEDTGDFDDEIRFGEPVKITQDAFYEGDNLLSVYDSDSDTMVRGNVFLDSVPPDLEIVSHSAELLSEGASASFTIYGEDLGSGLSSFTASLDGSLLALDSLSGEEKLQHEISIAVSDLADGQHVVSCVLRDRGGNEMKRSVHFYVDLTPPQLSYTGIKDGGIYGTSVSPAIRVKDVFGESLHGTAYLTRTDLSGRETREALSDFFKQSDDGLLLVKNIAEDGFYRLEAEATDAAGHTANLFLSFTVDQSAPIIRSIGESESMYVNSFALPAALSDLVSDYSDCEIRARLDGVFFDETKKVTDNGLHILKITAEDAFGRTSEFKMRFLISNTAGTQEGNVGAAGQDMDTDAEKPREDDEAAKREEKLRKEKEAHLAEASEREKEEKKSMDSKAAGKKTMIDAKKLQTEKKGTADWGFGWYLMAGIMFLGVVLIGCHKWLNEMRRRKNEKKGRDI